MPSTRRILVWANGDQELLIRSAVESGGLELVAVGSPRADSAAQLAKALGAERFDDLRQAVQRDDLGLIWLAAPDLIEPDIRRLIGQLKVPVICCRPPLASVTEM